MNRDLRILSVVLFMLSLAGLFYLIILAKAVL